MSWIGNLWKESRRLPIFAASAALIFAVAVVDWQTRPYVSLGILYLFPIMLAAGFLRRSAIVALGASCAVLAERFSSLDWSWTRLSLEALALAGCGLFVSELVRNRRMMAESQERSRILIETSPVAIVAVDELGLVQMANQAAEDLMIVRGGKLRGTPIAAFLPELHFALRSQPTPCFRTSMRCQGRRDDGEAFLADVWFSTYQDDQSPRLAAIIAEVGEEAMPIPALARETELPELTARESEVARLVFEGLANKEIATEMGLSESVVKNALQQLFAKTGVRSRGQLVRIAVEQHLV